MSYIIFAIVLCLCLFLAVLVFNNNRKSATNRFFSATVITLMVWVTFNFLENEQSFGDLTSFFLRMDFFVASYLMSFWSLFCVHFKTKKLISGKFILGLALTSTVFSLLSFTDLIISNIGFIEDHITFDTGILFNFYALFILAHIIGSTIVLITILNEKNKKRKTQVAYILLGFTLMFIIEATINLFLQNYLSLSMYRVATYAVLIMIISTSYAIVRHQLMDMKVVILRGIIYSIMLAIVVMTYLIFVFLLSIFFAGSQSVGIVGALATTIVGIYGVPVIERYFRRWSDKIFFKGKYDYTEALFDLGEIINYNIDLDSLVYETSDKLKNLFRNEGVSVIMPKRQLIFGPERKFKLLDDELNIDFTRILEERGEVVLFSSELPYYRDLAKARNMHSYVRTLTQAIDFSKKYSADLIVAVLKREKLEALILLEKKMSGDMYSREDVSLLRTFAQQAAVAIEKAQLYKRVKEYAVELEEKVEHRTSKINGLQKAQEQMMLEIAHGLQTPITVIKGELDALKHDNKLSKNSEELKKFNLLERSLDRISRLIYDMLKLARLESRGRGSLKETVDMSDLLLDLVETFQVITEEKGIKIESKLQEDVTIIGDKSEMEEMIMNLVSNSVKYMDDEKKDKWIRIEMSSNISKIELSIEDCGIGIPKEHMSHLFERFYHIKDKYHEGKRSTGLGLPICKKIIENHNGTIDIQSVAGEGTKVKIVFRKKI